MTIQSSDNKELADFLERCTTTEAIHIIQRLSEEAKAELRVVMHELVRGE